MLTAQAQTVIQNFDGYADQTAFDVDLEFTQPNSTAVLGTTSGVGGSQSFEATVNNGASPFFGGLIIDVTDFVLDGTTSFTAEVKFLSGSNENLNFSLRDEFGSTWITGGDLATQSISSGSFDAYTINTTGLTGVVDTIGINFGAIDSGTTSVAIDNLAIVPEPGIYALLSGLCALSFAMVRRHY